MFALREAQPTALKRKIRMKCRIKKRIGVLASGEKYFQYRFSQGTE